MTKQNFAIATFGMVALILAATPGVQQQNRSCGPREGVVTRLAERYGETRRSIGLGARNHVVEVFASADTGTWTITVTTPNGTTCLVASGRGYESLTETLPAGGTDT